MCVNEYVYVRARLLVCCCFNFNDAASAVAAQSSVRCCSAADSSALTASMAFLNSCLPFASIVHMYYTNECTNVCVCVCVSACVFDATWRAHTHTDKPQNHMPSPNQKQKCTRENAGKSNMFGPGTVAALPPYARKMLHSGNAGRDVDASSGIAAFNITKQILMLAEAQLDLQIYVCTHTHTITSNIHKYKLTFA